MCKQQTNSLVICKGQHSFFCESCAGDGEQACDQCKYASMFGNTGAFSDLLPLQGYVSSSRYCAVDDALVTICISMYNAKSD